MSHRDLQKPSCSDSGTLPLEGIGMCTSHRLDRGIKQMEIIHAMILLLSTNGVFTALPLPRTVKICSRLTLLRGHEQRLIPLSVKTALHRFPDSECHPRVILPCCRPQGHKAHLA
jgi:hypothetical protein